MFVNILANPLIWNISQFIFGSNSQKKELYRSLIKNKGKLLDFGCANGNTFLAFKDFDYTGLDIDSKAIDYASKHYSAYSNAKFICADILENTLKKESFDSILFAGTGHHIPNDVFFEITKSLSRLLKKGGSLYFVDMIKDKKRTSKLLSLLISLDQGKFHKDQEFYNKNLKNFSEKLKPIYSKTHIISNTLMPQPTYYIAEFKKI